LTIQTKKKERKNKERKKKERRKKEERKKKERKRINCEKNKDPEFKILKSNSFMQKSNGTHAYSI
jgi:hypothetical protein